MARQCSAQEAVFLQLAIPCSIAARLMVANRTESTYCGHTVTIRAGESWQGTIHTQNLGAKQLGGPQGESFNISKPQSILFYPDWQSRQAGRARADDGLRPCRACPQQRFLVHPGGLVRSKKTKRSPNFWSCPRKSGRAHSKRCVSMSASGETHCVRGRTRWQPAGT